MNDALSGYSIPDTSSSAFAINSSLTTTVGRATVHLNAGPKRCR